MKKNKSTIKFAAIITPDNKNDYPETDSRFYFLFFNSCNNALLFSSERDFTLLVNSSAVSSSLKKSDNVIPKALQSDHQKKNKGKRLLRYTGKPISAIAAYLGFSSQSHFANTF